MEFSKVLKFLIAIFIVFMIAKTSIAQPLEKGEATKALEDENSGTDTVNQPEAKGNSASSIVISKLAPFMSIALIFGAMPKFFCV